MSQKQFQPNKLAGFFHGIDPATKNDYYTDAIHLLTHKPTSNTEVQGKDFKWLPLLVDIVRLKKRDPNDIMDIQIKLFNRFPPMYATIDSTREDFLSSALQRKYGETRIIPMKFSNTGSSNTKFKLKQLGYAYIQAGYEWPNINKIEVQFPRYAKLLRLLKKEMMHEQQKATETGRVTFSHPLGKHNDLVHAWEMSLNSVMEFQKKNLGFEKRQNENPMYQDILSNIYKKYKTSDQDAVADVPIYDRTMSSSIY